jgi:hypothetical protein
VGLAISSCSAEAMIAAVPQGRMTEWVGVQPLPNGHVERDSGAVGACWSVRAPAAYVYNAELLLKSSDGGLA